MITGRLENWKTDPHLSILWGDCYDDVHKRWEDGTWIHTSYVKGLYEMDLREGDKIITRNSVYLLGKPYDKISWGEGGKGWQF